MSFEVSHSLDGAKPAFPTRKEHVPIDDVIHNCLFNIECYNLATGFYFPRKPTLQTIKHLLN